MINREFDIVIIGGGHAGCEAAYIASQFNLNVCILTMKNIGLASAPCNPSIGGVGKGQIVRELDALGGLMPQIADLAGIQYRTLNESKGYAVRSTRVQIDKDAYSFFAEEIISSLKNVEIIKETVCAVTRGEPLYSILTKEGTLIKSKKIIFTTGTFLNGKMHSGSQQVKGGRINAGPSLGLGEIFSQVKCLKTRFKTGTPARIKSNSINYSELEIQLSDDRTRNFSTYNTYNLRNLKQKPCFLTHTNENTLKVIRENKEKSPMYNGQINGVGARYCPSIEDKAYRYPDKNVHHVFLEPEGVEDDSVYPSGVSTSLPPEIQSEFLKTIKGLENLEIKTFGYAVEYDVVDTSELDLTLEYRDLPGVYFAGQVNGTSGYEEAAAQGFVAGCNAALSVFNKEKLIFNRNDSYIGVLVDDLVLCTRDEPYRLFTARAENRLFLREDNSIIRMWSYRSTLNLNNERDIYNDNFKLNFEKILKITSKLRFNTIDVVYQFLCETYNQFKEERPSSINIEEILKKPYLDPVVCLENIFYLVGMDVSIELISAISLTFKYDGYISLFNEVNNKVRGLENKKIDWKEIINSKNVSFECRQRIEKYKPQSFGHLKKIEGIRPATLSVVATDSL